MDAHGLPNEFYVDKIGRPIKEGNEENLDFTTFEETIYDLFSKWKVNKVVSDWVIFF